MGFAEVIAVGMSLVEIANPSGVIDLWACAVCAAHLAGFIAPADLSGVKVIGVI